MSYELTEVQDELGKKYKAIQINGIFLAHPDLNSTKLGESYVYSIVRALEDDAVRKHVLGHLDAGNPLYILGLSLSWIAPLELKRTDQKQPIAVIRYL